MIFQDKNSITGIDTLAYLPIIPEIIDNASLTNGQTVNHWKINNNLKYIDSSSEKDISVYNPNGTFKTAQEIYNMISSWEDETVFNAFFNGDLEAGNIKGGGENIDKLVIKRLSPETKYKIYENVCEIPYDKTKTKFSYKDYLISSSQVYLYSIQPVTKNNHYGALQNKIGALNRYEYSWLIDTDGSQIQILNSAINSISVNTKDGIIETIGGKTPYVNRFANLSYRSFTLSGTISTVFDTGKHITPLVDELVYSQQEDIQEIINSKFIEKTGELPTKESNSMRIDYNYERIFREKITDILKNGHKKLFKSPTEGLILIKLTSINLTPKTTLGRIIYDFSATATEVGEFNSDALDDFNLKGVISVE